MNFPIDNPINNDSKLVKIGENKQISDDFNKIGTFIIDLSFIQIDNSLNKLVINLTSSNTTQGTTFFVPRYTQSIKNFLNYTEFDDKNKPLSIIDIQKKQLEVVTNRSSLEKYMDKYKSKFELSKEQIDMIKKEGDIKVSIASSETIFENNAKFILKNVIFNNPFASFLYKINDKNKPSYIKINNNEINTILNTVTFLPDRYSSKNIEGNIIQDLKNKNLRTIKKEIDKEIKNITDVYGNNESSKTLLDEINKRRDLQFLYINYKIRVIQETLRNPGLNPDNTLEENIKKIWDLNINTNTELKKFNIGTNLNEFSNEVRQLNREFKKMMDLRIKRNAKYKLTVIIDPANIIPVPEKPLNPLKKEDREKIKTILRIKFQNLKKSCRKGDQEFSAKQKKIIDMCKKICVDEKNCKWCDICSTIVNCSMDETILSKCRQKKEEERKKKLESTKKGGTRKFNKIKKSKKSKKIKSKLKFTKKIKKIKKIKIKKSKKGKKYKSKQ